MTAKYDLLQQGLQVVFNNSVAKYDLLQTGVQIVSLRKTTKYDLLQVGTQIIKQCFFHPQHVQYSIYELPLEVVYEPAPETVQFSHCLEAGYFFSVDHFGELNEGGTITVRVYGGVPPYTWSLDVGTALELSDTETDDPYVTLSIIGAFEVGTEELTVEDACGSQATVCIYLCDGYADSSYTCLSEFSCDEHCRRTVVPIEPPTPPTPPLPPTPPEPPEPPLAPHETRVLTAIGVTDLLNLNLLIVSFWNDPDNTEVRLLWDLDKGLPYAFVTKEEYDARYGFLSSIDWLNDLLVEGGSAALGTKNRQKYPSVSDLEFADFGYPVVNSTWGCGGNIDVAMFVPLWLEDSETIVYGAGGGVNYSDDMYDAGFPMPPWGDGVSLHGGSEVTVRGKAVIGATCESRENHVWPGGGGPEWASWYEQKFSAIQRVTALLTFNVGGVVCPPYSYAIVEEGSLDLVGTLTNISIKAIDIALGANETHQYVKGRLNIRQEDPGDWGSISLIPGEDAYFTPDPSFIRTSMQYSGVYFHQGFDPWDGPKVCTNFAPGTMGARFTDVLHEELFYEYFTHFGRIGLFYPHLGLERGEASGHRKLKIVANADLQCQIFLFQRSETTSYFGGKTQREGTFHAALDADKMKHFPPQMLPRKISFESALDELFKLYYTENDYDSGEDMASKIDGELQIRVGVTSVSSVVKFFELPLEVVYERS